MMRPEKAVDLASAFLRLQYEDAKDRFNLAYGHTDFISAEDARTDYEERATWYVRFFMNRDRLGGIDLFPGYVEVFVDEQTGEAWQCDRKGNKSAASWRIP